MHDPIEQMSTHAKACTDRLRELPTELLPYNWQEFQRRSRRRLGSTGGDAGSGAGLHADPNAGRNPNANAGRNATTNAGSNVIADARQNVGTRAELCGAGPDVSRSVEVGAGQNAMLSMRPNAGPNLRSENRLKENRLNWRHMAAAAVLLLIVCGTAVWGRWGRDAHDSVMQDASPQSAANQSDSLNDRPNDRLAPSNVASVAVLRSRAIEDWLATLPREPVVVHVGTRAAVAQLEDRIAQVDDLLTSVRLEGMRPDGLAALQQERVRLVGSLAQVRYAEFVAAESP